ncbi:uncharacterized protein LOC141914195 [Tubulanus polymorphus]|uniref:uncharacterized protein LOC141914195 n=1 Tax=Tubulanus polymorphus TaxID=672921 RepID=UPI003DA1CF86
MDDAELTSRSNVVKHKSETTTEDHEKWKDEDITRRGHKHTTRRQNSNDPLTEVPPGSGASGKPAPSRQNSRKNARVETSNAVCGDRESSPVAAASRARRLKIYRPLRTCTSFIVQSKMKLSSRAFFDDDTGVEVIVPEMPVVDVEPVAELAGSAVETNAGAADQQTSAVADSDADPRLVVISSKVKNLTAIYAALLPNVAHVQYKYESSSLESIRAAVSLALSSSGAGKKLDSTSSPSPAKKVHSIAFIVHGTNHAIHLSGKDDQIISKDTIKDNSTLIDFLASLVKDHVDPSSTSKRVDFLASSVAQTTDSSAICRELESRLNIPVNISKDVHGPEISIKHDDASADAAKKMDPVNIHRDIKGWLHRGPYDC